MSTGKKLTKCPLCGGEIIAQAKKCKHCKEFVHNVPVQAAMKNKPSGSANEETEDVSVVNMVGRGNTSFNIANEGLACECDGWIYYINGNDNESIHKMRTDGSGNKKINNDRSDHINLIGDWIIYRNQNDSNRIHRIGIDGGESKRLHDKGTSRVKVVDDWIYYQGAISFETEEHKNLYRIKFDGTKEQRIGDVKLYTFEVFDEGVYCNDANNNYILYYMTIDGSDKKIVYDEMVENILGIDDGWLYIISLGNLYRLDLSSGELSQLTDYVKIDDIPIFVMNGNIIGDWFYFTDDKCLYRINLDGTGLEILANEEIPLINIAGGWLFYKSWLANSASVNWAAYQINADHPTIREAHEAVDSVDAETEIARPADMAKVVYAGGLKIVIPDGYIYTINPSETGDRVLVAMIPENDSITSIDVDFRMHSVESFTISLVISLNQDIDIASNGGPIVSMMMKMFPGETELIEAKNGLVKYYNELVPQDENDVCLIYNGYLVSEKGSIFNLQVQFNYNDGNYDLMKQKTIEIIKGIDYTGQNIDDYNQNSSLDEPIIDNDIKASILDQNGSIRLSDKPDKTLGDEIQAGTDAEQLADSVDAINKLIRDIKKLNADLEKMSLMHSNSMLKNKEQTDLHQASNSETQEKIILPNGSEYIGELQNGQPHGQGKMVYVKSGGNTYVGEFINGLPNGKGTETSVSGNKYVGEFKDGAFHGHGTMIQDGHKIVGEFKDGLSNGQGIVTFSNGSKYEGEFKDGGIHGHGEMTKPDGTIEKGEWRMGVFLGE